MIGHAGLKIELSQLKLGLPLKYDLVNRRGEVLATAGETVTPALKLRWNRLRIHTAYIRTASLQDYDQPIADPRLLQPLDPLVLRKLRMTMDLASDFVLQTTDLLMQGRSSNTSQAHELIERLQAELSRDAATVLAAFAENLLDELTDHDRMLAHRCSKLATLGLTIAHQLEFSKDDQQTTAIAAMFHDISLMDALKGSRHRAAYAESMTQHSLLSANLIEAIVGVEPKVILAVSQLHEQVDGAGYPKRLPANRIIPIARVLNVADAYLTLTELHQPSSLPLGCDLHPADALGYLMFHAAKGRFDRAVVRAMVDATSLYPVGCRVLLSDQSSATVLRSVKDSPSRPIIRADSASRNIFDLRQSQLTIVGPISLTHGRPKRLPKRNLESILWR